MNRRTPDGTAPRRLLRHNLLGWALGTLLVIWLALLALAWATGLHEARKFSDGQLVAIARLWLTAAPVPGAPADAGSGPASVASRLAHEYLQEVAVLVWTDGRLTTDTHGLAPGLDPARLPGQDFGTVDIATAGGGRLAWRAYAVPADPAAPGQRLVVLMDMGRVHELGRDMAQHIALPAVLVMPLVALMLWWAIRRGLRPLDRLSNEVARLDGFAGQRLDTGHRFQEFASTVTAINGLVDSLQDQAQRERAFASDVAHELRTPLAAIALQVQAVQDDPTPERLGQLEQESLRAGRILSQLLDLARAQRSGGGAVALAPVDLAAAAAAQIAAHAQMAHDSGHELALLAPEVPVVVSAPPLLLDLALRNLIENALRHTPAGTQVGVEVWQDGAGPGVAVSDDGQRLRETGPAGTRRDADGLGLGLRLVERIAAQMGATCGRDAGRPPMTTRFTLRWTASVGPATAMPADP